MSFDAGFWPYVLLALVTALALRLLAGHRVSRSLARCSRGREAGTSGMQLARQLLADAGLGHVPVQVDQRELVDSYDPRTGTLHLSSAVAAGNSIAAAAVVAHEIGHAQQDAAGYGPMRWRDHLVLAATMGWQAAPPMVLAGLGLTALTGPAGRPLGLAICEGGLAMFAAVVIFQLLTTPVELDASRRALGLLVRSGAVPPDAQAAARDLLRAAAFTYWAAPLGGIATLRSTSPESGRRRAR